MQKPDIFMDAHDFDFSSYSPDKNMSLLRITQLSNILDRERKLSKNMVMQAQREIISTYLVCLFFFFFFSFVCLFLVVLNIIDLYFVIADNFV